MAAFTEEFDYIIVGAGSAGCVLANRLSESGRDKVLLIEAGRRDLSPYIHMPGAVGKMICGRSHNWYFETAPQRQLNNRRLFFPQGKGIGGSSSINGMVYIRGNRADYDHWRQLGNVGWGYDDVLPYFKANENNARLNGHFHGSAGPLHVTDIDEPNPITFAFIEAAAELGVPRNPDFNGENQEGTGHFQQTVIRGRRWSSAMAFLRPALARGNLAVMSSRVTTRVLLEKGRAVGVETETSRGWRQRRFAARKEVIVSSGAVNSPKLLLLSGIGPAAELRELGIEPRHDLPGVGKNFHDHLDITSIYQSLSRDTFDGQDVFPRSIKHGLRYILSRKGWIANTPCQSAAYVRSHPGMDIPDISMHFLPVGILNHGLEPIDGHNLTFHNNIMRPRSRGEVRLASPDPHAAPMIDPNYLSDPYDMQVMIACIRWARKIMKTEAMRPFVGKERYPGVELQTDEQLAGFVRQFAETDYHPVGSCKMGHDDLAVVDDQLKVHGLRGLRVIDSSIMPAVISGNTNAPTIMIASKGADLVLGRPPLSTPEAVAAIAPSH